MNEKNLNEVIKTAVTAEHAKAGWDDIKSSFAKAFEIWVEEYRKDEKYLTDLANKTASNKSNHFIIVRSIVLDAHVVLDYSVSSIIGFMLVFRGEYHGSKYNGQETKNVIDYLHEKIDYSKRVSILEKLKILSNEAMKILREVNNIRVAFAHGKDTVKYDYFKESIFKKATIDRLQADKLKVISEYSKFLETCTSKK